MSMVIAKDIRHIEKKEVRGLEESRKVSKVLHFQLAWRLNIRIRVVLIKKLNIKIRFLVLLGPTPTLQNRRL